MEKPPIERFETVLRRTPKIILYFSVAFAIFSIFASFSIRYLLCALPVGAPYAVFTVISWKHKDEEDLLMAVPIATLFFIDNWARKHFLPEGIAGLAFWMTGFQFLSLFIICSFGFQRLFQYRIRRYLTKSQQAVQV